MSSGLRPPSAARSHCEHHSSMVRISSRICARRRSNTSRGQELRGPSRSTRSYSAMAVARISRALGRNPRHHASPHIHGPGPGPISARSRPGPGQGPAGARPGPGRSPAPARAGVQGPGLGPGPGPRRGLARGGPLPGPDARVPPPSRAQPGPGLCLGAGPRGVAHAEAGPDRAVDLGAGMCLGFPLTFQAHAGRTRCATARHC